MKRKRSTKGPSPTGHVYASDGPDESDYQAREDMRILVKAEEIKQDKARLRRAKACARRMRDQAARVVAER